ncbi:MAG: hypothetical protein ABSD29_15410 [Verrucomicrobiota bacterium]|jgi:hypothetical protein
MKTKFVPNLLAVISTLAAAMHAPSARAVPYASGVTNNSGTISFYLNEAGANVTIV